MTLVFDFSPPKEAWVLTLDQIIPKLKHRSRFGAGFLKAKAFENLNRHLLSNNVRF
jgi:hypothetical protein